MTTKPTNYYTHAKRAVKNQKSNFREWLQEKGYEISFEDGAYRCTNSESTFSELYQTFLMQVGIKETNILQNV